MVFHKNIFFCNCNLLGNISRASKAVCHQKMWHEVDLCNFEVTKSRTFAEYQSVLNVCTVMGSFLSEGINASPGFFTTN